MNHIRNYLKAFIGLCLLSLTTQAATITFNGTAGDGLSAFFGSTGATYSEAGFTFTALGGTMFWVDNGDTSFPGVATFDDDVLEFNSESGAFLELTRDGGGDFDMLGVRTGSLGRSAFDDGSFTFTGHYSAGGTISQTVLGLSTPSSYAFSGFTNLARVVISSSDGFFPVMDDLQLATDSVSVPEGGNISILLGLGMFALVSWRRIQR